MTAQALIAGSGFAGFSESGSARIGSVSGGLEKKGNSFDNIITKKMSGVNNGNQKVTDNNIVNKKITVNSNAVNCKEESGCDRLQDKDVNLINVYFVDGEIKVSLVSPVDDENSDMTGIDIDELLELIKKYLQDENDISEEDFERAMSECGFTMIDLLRIDNLQQFFVELNGMTEFSEILTDDSLLNSWNALVQSVSEMEIDIENVGTIEGESLLDALSDDDIFKAVKEHIEKESGNNMNVKVQDDSMENNVTVAEQNSDNGVNTEILTNGQSNQKEQSGEQFIDTDSMVGSQKEDVKSTTFNENLFETFIKNIQESVAGNERFDSGQIQTIRDIAFQIIEGVKVNVKADTSSLELSLNPESLGKVNVAIEMKDGICTANFIVRNELAKAAVESQLQTLKETFEERGLKVDAVEVNVSDFSFNQSRQTFSGEKEEKSGKSKIKIIRRKSVEDGIPEETEEVHNEAEQGIDLTA